MARQAGILPVKGTLDNITFVKTQDGYLARKKSSLNAERIANDPVFERTRENGGEFRKSAQAGKVLRTAFAKLIKGVADNRVTARLTGILMKVIKTDPTDIRGERSIAKGDLALLENFEFNKRAKLGSSVSAGYTCAFDRVSGNCTIEVPPFSIRSYINAPNGSTHYQFCIGVALIDFSEAKAKTDDFFTEMNPLKAETSLPISQVFSLTPNSVDPLFCVLGIKFFQSSNNQFYPLLNGSFNALCLIKVDVAG